MSFTISRKRRLTPTHCSNGWPTSFEWPRDADQELKPLAERIWNYTNDRRFTINELFRQNAVCELKIYKVVSEMLRIGQIATRPSRSPQLAKAS